MKNIIELNDYDVLGIGAEARQKLLSLPADYALLRHDHAFLPGVLESTLIWLKPLSVRTSSDFLKDKILRSCFEQIFKVAIQQFGESIHKLLKDYLTEMPWQEGLVRDHFRYFPEFVRRRFSDGLYYEIFQWEWIHAYLSYVDLGDFSKSEPGIIKVSPSLMTMAIAAPAGAVLSREPGLYAYVYSVCQNRVVEKHLNLHEVQILDLLSEDRKYSRVQLIEMFQEEISIALDSLQQSDIINR